MSDVLTPQQRRKCMSRIRGRDTKPEMVVRSLVHSLGYRYRLHVAKLAGTPDLVFPKYRKVIFVHGCFWHRHNCSKGRPVPATNTEFWERKFTENKDRDVMAIKTLEQDGWGVLVIWECEARVRDKLTERVLAFLG